MKQEVINAILFCLQEMSFFMVRYKVKNEYKYMIVKSTIINRKEN